MAKAKYKLYADGYYRTRAWDGTYNPDGSKHRINLKSKKSSKDLEQKVNELKMQIAQNSPILNLPILHSANTLINGLRFIKRPITIIQRLCIKIL